MPKSCLRLLFACLAAALPLWVHSLGGEKAVSTQQAAPAPSIPAVQQPLLGKPVGMAGCAAEACHGGTPPVSANQPEKRHGLAVFNRGTEPINFLSKSSFTTWHQHDPHANAFDVLKNELSRKIVKNLPRIANGATDGTTVQECLACHSNPTLANRKFNEDAAIVQLRKEGVGCEACHGNAGGWLTEHTAWKPEESRTGKYEAGGLKELYDLSARATTCIGCHVGAPATGDAPLRDVNHDLIAAGHPRLNFEYTTYLRRLPAHWTEKDRTKAGQPGRDSNIEQVAWVEGQKAVRSARADLLEVRLRGPVQPEFAEFSCFGCHQSIGKDPAPMKSGRLVWKAPPGLGGEFAEALLRPLKADEKPADAFRKEIEGHRLDIASALAAARDLPKEPDWDDLNWRRSLLIAVANARGRSGEPGFANNALKLRNLLSLRRDKDIFNSPMDADLASAKLLVEEMLKGLEKP